MLKNAMLRPAAAKSQILVCDDDIAFCAELVEALRMRGYAASALLTLSAIRAAILAPSIIILDICMPEPDGIEILNMLAAHDRQGHFKIILVSGSDGRMLEMAAKLCRVRGLNLLGSFRKPVMIKALFELLEGATENSAAPLLSANSIAPFSRL